MKPEQLLFRREVKGALYPPPTLWGYVGGRFIPPVLVPDGVEFEDSMFTGYTDPNGQKVFEGDTLIFIAQNPPKHIHLFKGVVTWRKYGFYVCRGATCYSLYQSAELGRWQLAI